MSDHTLRDCHVLVVQDEYMLADDLCSELREAEAIVLGPVGTLRKALELTAAETGIDGAVLDINLRRNGVSGRRPPVRARRAVPVRHGLRLVRDSGPLRACRALRKARRHQPGGQGARTGDQEA